MHKSPNFDIRPFVHTDLKSSMNCIAFKRSNFRTIRTFVLAKFCRSFVHLRFRSSQFKLFCRDTAYCAKTNLPIRKRLPPSCRARRDLSSGIKMSKPEIDCLVTAVYRTLDVHSYKTTEAHAQCVYCVRSAWLPEVKTI